MRETEDPVVTARAGDGANGTDETHPAFAVAVVHRIHTSSTALFQSDVLHHDTVRLSVHGAVRTRDLSHDWVHPREELITVEMSLSQWGALVSSIGIGSGVPVTLRATSENRSVPGLPYQPRIQESLDEVTGSVSKLLAHARESLANLTEAIEQKMGVRAVRDALRTHSITLSGAERNAEFVVNSMADAGEKITSQVRADIEAQILDAARAAGTHSRPHTITAPELRIDPPKEVE